MNLELWPGLNLGGICQQVTITRCNCSWVTVRRSKLGWRTWSWPSVHSVSGSYA